MTTIKVNTFLDTAFDMEDGKILKEKLMPYIESGESVIVDFNGVEHFTPLFFNTSLCPILFDIGKNKYDSLFIIINLPDYARNSYEICYEDTIDNPFKGLNDKEKRELSRKLLNIDEEDD